MVLQRTRGIKMNTFRALQRLISPIITRIRRVCMGAIIRRVDDSGNLQKMQVETLGHSVYDNVEKFEQFGFTSNPPLGLDAIIIERAGKHIIVAIGDRKYRIKNMKSGDTAIYDVRGQTIILNETGIATTDAHGNKIITDSSGIKTTDTNGNDIKMEASGISLTDKNGNNIKMSSAGVDINGVLITKSGAMTTPSTIVAGDDITSGTGKTLDTHVHTFPYMAGSSSANGTTNPPSA